MATFKSRHLSLVAATAGAWLSLGAGDYLEAGSGVRSLSGQVLSLASGAGTDGVQVDDDLDVTGTLTGVGASFSGDVTFGGLVTVTNGPWELKGTISLSHDNIQIMSSGPAGAALDSGWLSELFYTGWGAADESLAATEISGSGTTVTLAHAGVSDVDDYYNGMSLAISGGTGVGQQRTITDFNGTTHVATLDRALDTALDTDSEAGIFATPNRFRGVIYDASEGELAAIQTTVDPGQGQATISDYIDLHVGSLIAADGVVTGGDIVPAANSTQNLGAADKQFDTARFYTWNATDGDCGYINIPDNAARGFGLYQGSTDQLYIEIVTTNGSEAVNLGNATTNPSFNFLGSGGTTFAGNVIMDGVLKGTNDGTGLVIGHVGGQASEGSTLQLVSMTTTQKDYLVGAAGQLVWDSTLGGVQYHNGSGWASLSPNHITVGLDLSPDAFLLDDSSGDIYIALDTTDAAETLTLGNTSNNPTVLLYGSVFTATATDALNLSCASGSWIIGDNNAAAFTLREGILGNYLVVDTTDDAEAMSFGNATTNPSFSFLGTGRTSFAGGVNTSSVCHTFTASGAVAQYDIVYVSADGSVTKAIATSLAACLAVGSAPVAIGDTDPGLVQYAGELTVAMVAGLTSVPAGTRIFVSETAGKGTSDVSGFSTGSYIRCIGIVTDGSSYDNGAGGTVKCIPAPEQPIAV